MREQIKPEDLGRFSIDEKNRLYWDNQEIHTELTLSRKQSVWAVIVAVAAIVSALASSANAMASVWTAFFKP